MGRIRGRVEKTPAERGANGGKFIFVGAAGTGEFGADGDGEPKGGDDEGAAGYLSDWIERRLCHDHSADGLAAADHQASGVGCEFGSIGLETADGEMVRVVIAAPPEDEQRGADDE